MDHLGIKQFLFMGYCIGGCFAFKLMERAPERVAAGVLVQTVGHHPEHPDYMYNSGREPGRWSYSPAARYQHGPGRAVSPRPLPRPARIRLQRIAGLRALLPDADLVLPDETPPTIGILCRGRLTLSECRDHGVPVARAA